MTSPYVIKLSNGTTLTTIYPYETSGPGGESTPFQVGCGYAIAVVSVFGGVPGTGYFVVAGNVEYLFNNLTGGFKFTVTAGPNAGNYTVGTAVYQAIPNQTYITVTVGTLVAEATSTETIQLQIFLVSGNLTLAPNRFVSGFPFTIQNPTPGPNDGAYSVLTGFNAIYDSVTTYTAIPVAGPIPVFDFDPFLGSGYQLVYSIGAPSVLTMVGEDSLNWGQDIWEDMVHMVENYADSVPPNTNPNIGTNTPLTGQIWYNTGTTTFEFWNGSAWVDLATGGGASPIDVDGAGSTTLNIGTTFDFFGTANQITTSVDLVPFNGVKFSIPTTFVAPGSITATTTLTVSGNTANSFLYSGTSGQVVTTAAPSNGQLLIGSTGAAPVASNLSAGSGISILNGAGTISITNTGVTSFSTGTTGLTPVGPATGVVTLAGTLIVGNGGTGATSFTSHGVLYGNGAGAVQVTAAGTTGQVLIGNTGGAPSWTNAPAISGANFTTNTMPNGVLTNSGVTAGGYGAATTVPVINVNTKGIITSAANVAIPVFGGTSPGLVPTSPGGTVNSLLANGTWGVPSGSSSVAANGHTTLPGGVLMQWGTGPFHGISPQTVTFPIPFPTACFVITVTPISNLPMTGAESTGTSDPSASTTGFTLNSGAGLAFSWIALGH